MKHGFTFKSKKFTVSFSAVILITALLVLFGMGMLLKSSSERMEALDHLEGDRGYCERAITELEASSGYLTAEVWGYAVDGDVSHLQNYWQEVEVKRTRDTALEKLLHTNLTEEERTHMMRAKAYSDGLIYGEVWSMRMLAEGYGESERDMPQQVRRVVLSAREKALSREEKLHRGRSYLFGREYAERKNMIMDMVNAFNEDLTKRLDRETKAMRETNRAANRYAVAVVVLLLAFMGILLFSYVRLMRHKNRELELALAKAEAASTAKSYFTSRMSHEIRTPLNAVLGYLHIAEKSTDEADRADSLHKSRVAAANLLHIVNDVLDLSAIENGKMQLAREPYNVCQLMDDLQVVYASLAKQKGILFQAVAQVEKEWLRGDAMRVNQILTNLLSNALKFTAAGGQVTLQVSQQLTAGCRIFYRVEDTGIGMSEDFLEHIFDAYEQEDGTIHQRFGGTGLGTSIVKSLVDRMGGTIEVTSQKGKGSVFQVMLPGELLPAEEIEKADAMRRQARAAAGDGMPAEAAPLQGMHILLAEDNAMNTEIAQNVLESMGASVRCAQNGREAVEIFNSSVPGSLDVILMDIIMPEMDGYTATRNIRGSLHPDAARIPVVAMSANAFASDVRKSLESGMNAHLAKPIDVPVLRETLRNYRRQ